MTRTTNARLAGFMFLFYIATGIAGMVLFAPATSGEGTAAKLASIAQHATLTRVAAVYSLLMMMNPFVLGVALYALTRDYDRDLALLALMCRLTEGVIAAMSAVSRRALLSVATAAAGTSGADAAAANALGSALLNVQGVTTLIGATVFAIGSTLFSYLFLRARTIPVSLAWLGVLASVLLVVGLPLQIAGFIEGSVTLWMWIPMALFEVIFALWLLIKGVAPYPPQPVRSIRAAIVE
jgi:uncharacterized protein DUF4386